MLQDENRNNLNLKRKGLKANDVKHDIKKSKSAVSAITEPTFSDDLFDAEFDSFKSDDIEAAIAKHEQPKVTELKEAQKDLLESDFSEFELGSQQLNDIMQQHERPLGHVKMRHEKYFRCRVVSVEDFTNKYPPEKMLTVMLVQSDHGNLPDGVSAGSLVTVLLKDEWAETECQKDDIVNVVAELKDGGFLIDRSEGFIILHPDTLISTTLVSQSFTCKRRSVLSDRLSFSNWDASVLYGSLIHEIFEESVKHRRFLKQELLEITRECIQGHIDDLYALNLTIDDAIGEMSDKLDNIITFAKKYLRQFPTREGSIEEGRRGKDVESFVCFPDVVDIEENIWAPKWGLKGKIDLTVNSQIEKVHAKAGAALQKPEIVPFELKSGKQSSSTSHRAQTSFYTLMISDAYNEVAEYGLLYYIYHDSMVKIPRIRPELTGLVIGRNLLASHCKSKTTRLPPVIDNGFICTRCYANTACTVFHKFEDNGSSETFGDSAIFEELTSHLTKEDFAFFKQWNTLMSLEELHNVRNRKDIWIVSADKREAEGRCWANMLIDREEVDNTKKFGKYKYTFKRMNRTGKSLLDSQLSGGDSIVVSAGERIAVAIGFVVKVASDYVIATLDRSIRFGKKKEEFSYRIDGDVFSTGMSTVRSNLMSLFAKRKSLTDSGVYLDIGYRTRERIVHLKPPQFENDYNDASNLNKITDTMNPSQKAAILKSLNAKDYCLIWGTPGSGKTTTIVSLIKSLTLMGRSVLLSTYTHTALDHLLFKLKVEKMDFVRLGQPDKVAEELHEYLPSAHANEDIANIYNGAQIVATTCLGVSHPIFTKRQFDFCIIDEAAQITLPACIGPLRFCSRFILVGDDKQLPPVVQNLDAKNGGYDKSLFQLLAEAHPSSLVQLNYQYRMNQGLMDLANRLFYDNRLVCGNEIIAKRKLLPSTKLDGLKHHEKEILNSSKDVIFLNTDNCPGSTETNEGNAVTNRFEANLVNQVVSILTKSGVEGSKIGISSPYRSQLKHIRIAVTAHSDVQALTVDQFQGQERECMIISFVRSNSQQNIGELLKDWRRLNVAITRARSKLILIGSVNTLKSYSLYQKLFEILEEKKCIIPLSLEDNKENFNN